MPWTAPSQADPEADGASSGVLQPATAAGRASRGSPRLSWHAAAILRRHWLITILLAAGLALRIIASIAYRPALLYIDTLKYLYNAWPGTDPVGYKVPLRLILLAGNLETVAAVQHAVGLGIAVTIYTVLSRRGTRPWLAACAAAPVLLDAYQLQIEQTVMPDVWFEALIVAGLAVLAWRPRPGLAAAGTAGILLGATATLREIGEILALPAVIYLAVAAGRGWRRKVAACLVLAAGFAAPIILYSGISDAENGHFQLSRSGTSQAYGRFAEAADCATLRIPAYERPLCPDPRQKALGTDGLDHDATSPLNTYVAPPGMDQAAIVSGFSRAVLTQQPLNVLHGMFSDATKLFAVTRHTFPGDIPVSRWQFQAFYPGYGQYAPDGSYIRYISVNRDGYIVLGLNQTGQPGGPYVYQILNPSYGGKAAVSAPLARFLRGYQLRGGYTPGPLFAIAAVAGLAGSAAAAWRRSPAGRAASFGCLLFFLTAAAILLGSDFFEFSWRYQLPALVTLVPAGALGLAALIPAFSSAADPRTGQSPEPALRSGPAPG
jgi:hypothetical protein